jgi:hypothetical protein
MALVNRIEVLSEGEIQVVHCENRRMRRGFLCEVDELTGEKPRASAAVKPTERRRALARKQGANAIGNSRWSSWLESLRRRAQLFADVE